VLQEFYVQATRSAKKDRISHDQAILLIESWLRFSVQENTVQLMHSSFKASHRFHLSYWDAAIVEAARSLRCRILLSEDMNHGQDYDGVRVINPFL
jgi:predicted nucleic acid-binding protein